MIRATRSRDVHRRWSAPQLQERHFSWRLLRVKEQPKDSAILFQPQSGRVEERSMTPQDVKPPRRVRRRRQADGARGGALLRINGLRRGVGVQLSARFLPSRMAVFRFGVSVQFPVPKSLQIQ